MWREGRRVVLLLLAWRTGVTPGGIGRDARPLLAGEGRATNGEATRKLKHHGRRPPVGPSPRQSAQHATFAPRADGGRTAWDERSTAARPSRHAPRIGCIGLFRQSYLNLRMTRGLARLTRFQVVWVRPHVARELRNRPTSLPKPRSGPSRTSLTRAFSALRNSPQKDAKK